MSKHKEITMYTAEVYEPWQGGKSEVLVHEIKVVETPKLYKLTYGKEFLNARRSCGFRTQIKKEGNIWLFKTKKEALKNLWSYQSKQASYQKNALDRCKENLRLVTEHISIKGYQ